MNGYMISCFYKHKNIKYYSACPNRDPKTFPTTIAVVVFTTLNLKKKRRIVVTYISLFSLFSFLSFFLFLPSLHFANLYTRCFCLNSRLLQDLLICGRNCKMFSLPRSLSFFLSSRFSRRYK